MGYIDRGDDGAVPYLGFPDHFEWDGPRWLFYRHGWKAPVALSHDEHDRVIQQYEKGRIGIALFLGALVVALFTVPIVLMDEWPGPPGTTFGTTVAFVVAMVTSMTISEAHERWIVRLFKDRNPEGAPRDRNFMKHRRLAQMSWNGLLCWTVAMAFGLAASLAFSPGRYFWVAYVLLLAMLLAQAYQKWRFERRSATPTSA